MVVWQTAEMIYTTELYSDYVQSLFKMCVKYSKHHDVWNVLNLKKNILSWAWR